MQLDFLVALRFPSYTLSIYFLREQRLAARMGGVAGRGMKSGHKHAVFSLWRNRQDPLSRDSLPFLGLPTRSSADGFYRRLHPFSFHCPLFGLIKVQRLPWLLEFLPEIGNQRQGDHGLKGLPRPPLCAKASGPRLSAQGVQPLGLGTRPTSGPGQDLQVGCTKVWRVGTP